MAAGRRARHTRTIVLLTAVGAIGATRAASATGSIERWTVLPPVARGVAPQVAVTFADLLAHELRRQGSVQIAPPPRETVCATVDCARRAGAKVGARLAVFGTLSPLGAKIIVSLTVVDVVTGAPLRSERVTAARIEALDDAAARIAPTLASAAPRVGLHAAPDAPSASSSPPPSSSPHPVDTAPVRQGRPSFLGRAGRVITFTFGGLALATGTALLSVGLGTERDAFVYGGIPSLAGGGGLFLLGLLAAPEGGPILSRAGSTICFTFGGLALATGTTLLSVGLARDDDAFADSGIPSLVAGGALLLIGFAAGEDADGRDGGPSAAVIVTPTIGGFVAAGRF